MLETIQEPHIFFPRFRFLMKNQTDKTVGVFAVQRKKNNNSIKMKENLFALMLNLSIKYSRNTQCHPAL